MEKTEKRYSNRSSAKTIVDTLHEKNLLAEGFTRDQMNRLEDLVDILIESAVKSNIQAHHLMESLKKDKLL
jgi:hypothetical protein